MIFKNKYIHQWKGTESSYIKPYISCQLIFNKNATPIQWKKNSLFNSAGRRVFPKQKSKAEPCLTPYTKVNSNIRRAKITKLLDKNTEVNVYNLGLP